VPHLISRAAARPMVIVLNDGKVNVGGRQVNVAQG
jgi:hypothetical protein